MTTITLCTILELTMVFGLAGVFWPERLVSVFSVLLFPWNATHRGIRANSAVAIALSLALSAVLFISHR